MHLRAERCWCLHPRGAHVEVDGRGGCTVCALTYGPLDPRHRYQPIKTMPKWPLADWLKPALGYRMTPPHKKRERV